jgi:predicted ATPase
MGQALHVPRIDRVHVRNYRALRDLDLRGLKPLTVVVGRNGSGKSTLLDVFAFLSECFTDGLRRAWDRRGRFSEIRARDAEGPVEFLIRYKEGADTPFITYELKIDEDAGGPYVSHESLRWTRGHRGQPFQFLSFANGRGSAVSGETPDEAAERVPEDLESRETLAVSTLGQFARHPRVSALRRFVTDWYLSYLTVDSTRRQPEAGPHEHLSVTGDNLPNVIQYLKEQRPEKLSEILTVLKQRVPHLESADAELLAGGHLLLTIKDAPFSRPVLARFASDGTLKMLAYLTVLYDPDPPQLVGIEEPENHIHPRLLPQLAEECRGASGRGQVLVTTHSPYFLNGVRSSELRILYRDSDGYARAIRPADVPGALEMEATGASLGDLWTEGFLDDDGPNRVTAVGSRRPARGGNGAHAR